MQVILPPLAWYKAGQHGFERLRMVQQQQLAAVSREGEREEAWKRAEGRYKFPNGTPGVEAATHRPARAQATPATRERERPERGIGFDGRKREALGLRAALGCAERSAWGPGVGARRE